MIDFHHNNNSSKAKKGNNLGLIFVGVAGGSAILLSAICFPFVTPALRKICLPYVPATTNQMNNVLRALKGRQGSLIDLGSGDGRIDNLAFHIGPSNFVIMIQVLNYLSQKSTEICEKISGIGKCPREEVHEAAKIGFKKSVGVELNPWLVLYSRIKSISLGLSSSTTFYRRDLWKVSLQPYNNVVIFGVDSMMKDLESKCINELEPDSVIAACRFPFPTLQPQAAYGEGIDSVWIYSMARPLVRQKNELDPSDNAQ